MRAAALATLFFAAGSGVSFAQVCADNASVLGSRVRSVRPDARFGRVPQALERMLASHYGEVYSIDAENSYANDISRFFNEHPGQLESEVINRQALSIAIEESTPCTTVVAPVECQAAFGESRCIDILVKTISLQLDVYDISGNRLPIPRSNKMRFFGETPKALVAFNPQVTSVYDQRVGLQPAVSISNRLFASAAARPGSDAAAPGPTELWLRWNGTRSVKESFYDTSGSLSVVRRRPTSLIDRLGAKASVHASLEPRGIDDDRTRSFEGGADLGLQLPGAAFSRLRVGGGYRWTEHHFAGVDGSLDTVTESTAQANMVADGRLVRGFTRIAAWIDAGSPQRGDAYARLAGTIGYEKELSVAPNQAVGIEGIAGFGRSFGSVPPYSRFFGGNPSGNFLYDGIDSRDLASMPVGPPIRSAGREQLGASLHSGASIGADSYWHASLAVSLPIPHWSFPLIPAEVVMTTSDGSSKTLKDVLKRQVASGKELYVQATMRQMLTADEQDALRLDANAALSPADRERLDSARQASARVQAAVRRDADKIWREITPITNFIADEGNIYSIKPLLMIDAARMNSGASADAVTRIGMGGGVQLTVVIARLEAGYLWAVRRQSTDPRGNFVLRLALRNLF
jgi:hypothetical protein